MESEKWDVKSIPVELKKKVLSLPIGELSSEEKKLRRILHNRASAERSRKRRLELLEQLEKENVSLKKQIESLQPVKMENYRLKQQLKELDGATEDVPAGSFSF
ncbi:hypothetical protein GAYE_SCF04G2449 [Galdieria yellowstonensis]|uniref:BZIP domain-containing protein n=1 Tax=Galdieria yellowstonensis TaxID=3028027 RepID=A0AAV9IB45_9RHOD|nr:hypothetical protein GAYE_SCF04G2449 [Galdieria yellowstonensis]